MINEFSSAMLTLVSIHSFQERVPKIHTPFTQYQKTPETSDDEINATILPNKAEDCLAYAFTFKMKKAAAARAVDYRALMVVARAAKLLSTKGLISDPCPADLQVVVERFLYEVLLLWRRVDEEFGGIVVDMTFRRQWLLKKMRKITVIFPNSTDGAGKTAIICVSITKSITFTGRECRQLKISLSTETSATHEVWARNNWGVPVVPRCSQAG
ncbi:hypothetical protein EDB19DRAFT_1828691 [Suillus lakei]|nr:hypothetical protein EDB19DRAFT_1828691 [Suillus lakei]